jgi:hypothetical protein
MDLIMDHVYIVLKIHKKIPTIGEIPGLERFQVGKYTSVYLQPGTSQLQRDRSSCAQGLSRLHLMQPFCLAVHLYSLLCQHTDTVCASLSLVGCCCKLMKL